jgi:hypothetical protein
VSFPTTPIIDTFARANGFLDTSLACSNGIDSWQAGKINDSGAGTGGTITSNRLLSALGGTVDSYIATRDFGADVEVYTTFSAVPSTSYAFLAGRISDVGTATWDGYAVIWIQPNTWQLRRYDNGSSTVIATTTAGYSAGDQIGLSAIGDAITGYNNGAVVLSTTDATYGAAGKIGFEFADNTARMFNFGGGTYVAPTPTIAGGPVLQPPRRRRGMTSW